MKTYKRSQRGVLSLVQLAATLLVAAAAPPAKAEQLQVTTVAAFERYARSREARSNRELGDGKIFLSIDALPQEARNQAYADLKQGEIIIRRSPECENCSSISGGLIHDWTGMVFIPGISLSQTLAALQDYDRDVEYYRPQVVKSKLLERSGDDFRVYLRLKQVRIATVVLDTEYDVRYTHLDTSHAYSRSYSTRIAEVENAGEPQERDRPVGDDRGFLWRLYSYWRFYQADGGVYLQCNAISLTRDVPAGLGWMIRPFIENVPGESLHFTLDATRTALSAKFRAELGPSHNTDQSQHNDAPVLDNTLPGGGHGT